MGATWQQLSTRKWSILGQVSNLAEILDAKVGNVAAILDAKVVKHGPVGNLAPILELK